MILCTSFRDKPPHEIVRSNTERAILVWAEEYKWVFQLYGNLDLEINEELEQKSLESRVRLKKRLGCKDFHWCLQNASLMLIVPTDKRAVAHFGKVRNQASGFCLVGEQKQDGEYSLGQHKCIKNLQLGAEYFYLTRNRQLRIDDLCAAVVESATDPSPVVLRSCEEEDSRQRWNYDNGRLEHVDSGKCMDLKAGTAKHARTAHVTTCAANAEHQKWTFETWQPPPRR
jgi:polypeptide N-acetylgalactosaminyltransferase